MDRSRKDPTDERGGIDGIHEETDCCIDGACNWRDNIPAQSEGDKGGCCSPEEEH